jgi:hypothetical protein
MTEKHLPMHGTVLKIIPGIDEGYVPDSDVVDTRNIEEATVISSKVRDYGSPTDKHKVILDIDLRARLIPSSTPGHFHLYIDKEISWDRYIVLMHALSDAGIVEPGYVGASIARGYTAARLPWVKKGEGPPAKVEEKPTPATASKDLTGSPWDDSVEAF